MKAPAVKFLLCSVAMLMMISVATSAQVNGALQTTLSDGTIVNFNVKPPQTCDAIYITGGPQNTSAAGITPGSYFFRVTDPSGKTDLSASGDPTGVRTLLVGTDPISGATGRILGTTGTHPNGAYNPANGETTVQLWPFSTTPNNGGVYKAWISTTSDFTNSTTKTDNFKCTPPTNQCAPDDITCICTADPTNPLCTSPPPPSVDITGTKFYDSNANGIQDSGEVGIDNWLVSIDPPAEADVNSGTAISCTFTSNTGQYDFTVDLNTSFTITEGTDNTLNSIWHHTTATSGPVSSGDGSVNPVAGPNFGNVCLGGNGGGLTLGFWSNKNGQKLETAADFTFLSSLNLVNAIGGTFDPTSSSGLASWLLSANATNMAYMLSAQLTAMELNVRHSFVNGNGLIFIGNPPNTSCFSVTGEVAPNASGFIGVNDLMNDANLELGAPGGNYTVAAGVQRSCEEYKKTALDQANNNLNFPQPDGSKCPAFGFDTSSCSF